MSKKELITPPFRWVALFGGVFCILTFWYFQVYGIFPVEKNLGSSATVRFTPYHTAGKLLELNNTKVEHYRNLKALNQPFIEADTIVLSAKPGHMNPEKLDVLLKWVDAGGSLFYWANRKSETDTDLLLNHLDAGLVKDQVAEQDKEVEDLLDLGKEVLPMLGDLKRNEEQATSIQIADLETNIKIGFNPTWHLYDYSGNAYYYTDDDKDHLLQYLIGDGQIFLMSDMNIWNNANIDDHDHGFFLQSMIMSGADQDVWFMFGGEHESAFNKLRKQAMPLFWIGLLFLVLWLWRQIPRVGPKLSLNLYQRRNIGEHIAASSQLRWQLKQLPQWVANQRKIIFKHAAIRNPGFSQLSQEEQMSWLATVGSVDRKQLTYLYDHSGLNEFKELQFLELMHQLQKLKSRL
ncbi:DUF4350 domain-containing protein [Kangiella sp. HZ709]|uniref:DUF4350 domain-containing protein n=1 Tax=Kangiella sp. HZ709 TaxID=2666328 RepID=UPI0012B0E613|nr:DUF4350 domain-containing protein [Kangiella sp. HZ709]MRX28139.1 hypothetical protein [Kangiella sp. HZ709]